MEDPGFRERVDQAQQDTVHRVNGRLADMSAAAAQRLDELVLVYSRNESVAVQVIRLALDHTRKLRDGTQGQADAPLLTTDILLKEPHYGKAEQEADLKELSEGD